VQIEYKKKAVKYINSCDKPTKQRLKESIEALPLGDVIKLSGLDCEYRLRVGDLRVLFTLEDDGKITVNDIKPRGQAYKRL
jgi:mRNA interferase RelE/StbE